MEFLGSENLFRVPFQRNWLSWIADLPATVQEPVTSNMGTVFLVITGTGIVIALYATGAGAFLITATATAAAPYVAVIQQYLAPYWVPIVNAVTSAFVLLRTQTKQLLKLIVSPLARRIILFGVVGVGAASAVAGIYSEWRRVHNAMIQSYHQRQELELQEIVQRTNQVQSKQITERELEEAFAKDPFLDRFVCAMTLSICAEPVKIVCSNGHVLYYERELILDWYHECVNRERPFTNPRTKEVIPLTESELVVDVQAVQFIARRKQEVLEEMLVSEK